MTEHLINAAKAYFQNGTPVVAVNQKKPLVEWAHWQTQEQKQNEFEVQPWLNADGFAIVCGTKTKNSLYVAAIDFDVKNLSPETKETGLQILKQLLTTQIEETINGGQHWIYLCHNKPKTTSTYHNECAIELLGEGKLCIMAPSHGYKRLNDNEPTILTDLETELYEAMHKAGFKPKTDMPKTEVWFDRKDLASGRFKGQTPPCIEALYRGAKEGLRNEQTIRLASFLVNFRKVRSDRALEQMRKINKLNEPPLDDQELQGIIRSALNGGYVYGCQDALLKKNCNRDECPIAPANIAKMLSKDEMERAEAILSEGKVLEHVLTFGKRRLIGENNTLLSNFVLFCSGRTKYPISGVISGFSGSGKNESIRAIKPLIPKEWYFEFTTSTPEAMKYLPEDFDGTLIIYEALGVRGDSGSLSLRAIGEGESIETIYPMRNEVTGKMEMGRAKTNAKNFVTTSSDIDINPDLYRRVLKHTMNHSTGLTKRVMAKKIRDAAYPESLKAALGLQKELPFKLEDFQNALRLVNWQIEVVVFTPTALLSILNLAVKREQEVALRTHLEKILHFTRILALINQKKRLHVKIGALEFIVAEPQDLFQALNVLRDTIAETISRIEKRQEEVLELFASEDTSLNKHDVASRLKITTKTAARALRTLASAGYLKEETQNRMYQYRLLQEKPNHLLLLENEDEINLFHRISLRKWLNAILPTGHTNGTSVAVFDPEKGKWETDINQITITKLNSNDDHVFPKPQTVSAATKNPPYKTHVEDGKMPIMAIESSNCEKEHNIASNSQRRSQLPSEALETASDSTSSLEALALKTKSLIREHSNSESETCILCNTKDTPQWQVTLFDDSWGFLCGLCGDELSRRLTQP